MSKKTVLICLAVVAALFPCAVAPASAASGAPTAAFAYHACSPWDGPAVRVIVSYGPSPSCDRPGAPSLTLLVNYGLSKDLSGLVFALEDFAESEAGRNGSAYFCPDSVRCRPMSNVSVTFGQVNERAVSGTIECLADCGQGIRFEAVVCPSYDICG